MLIGQNLPCKPGSDEHFMVKRNVSHFDDCRVSSNLSEISSNLTAKVCSGINTQKVPKQICINATNLERKKGPYDQFKFPRTDPPLTEAGKLEIPKIESLEYIVNLLAGKLQPELKNIWDQISGRDVSKTEISKSGMQLTGYDIKNLACEDMDGPFSFVWNFP